jgi:hypothetical protein
LIFSVFQVFPRSGHIWMVFDVIADDGWLSIVFIVQNDTAAAPISWRNTELFSQVPSGMGVQESDDGTFVLPPMVMDGGIGAYSVQTGEHLRWWYMDGLRPSRVLTMPGSPLPGHQQVFLSHENSMVVVQLSLTTSSPVLLSWSFDWYQLNSNASQFERYLVDQFPTGLFILPHGSGNTTILVTSSSLHPSSDPAASDALRSFSSAPAPHCLELVDLDPGNCNSCDALTGTRTARNCAWCVSLLQCAEYLPPYNVFPSGPSCPDSNFPLPADEACEVEPPEPSSLLSPAVAGIIIGSIAGVGIIAWIAWWCRKNKKMYSGHGDAEDSVGYTILTA